MPFAGRSLSILEKTHHKHGCSRCEAYLLAALIEILLLIAMLANVAVMVAGLDVRAPEQPFERAFARRSGIRPYAMNSKKLVGDPVSGYPWSEVQASRAASAAW